jgi:hypothetical protein
MPDTEWTSPRKMLDYYMDQSDGIEACEKRLYLAAIKGEVRARLKDRVLGRYNEAGSPESDQVRTRLGRIIAQLGQGQR